MCAKYTDMQAMASRTLLFNSTEAQQAAYQTIFDAQMHLISKLKPGIKISEAYSSTVDMIKSKDPKLVNQLHVNLGFGIGSKYKEEELSIKADNHLCITDGMVFHVRITLKDVDGKGPMALADTVLVQANGEA